MLHGLETRATQKTRMFHLRFNQVFVGLMALSFLSAFFLPQTYSDRVRNIQGLFIPVARPAAALGSVIRGRLFPAPSSDDHRREADVRAENDALKVELANLQAQVEALQHKSGERESVGLVGQYSVPITVVGPDAGTRQSLSLEVTPRQTLRRGMAVVYPGGFVGQVDRVGAGGAQVRLLTDLGFKVLGFFRRDVPESQSSAEMKHLPTRIPLIQGAGRGMMVVKNLELKEAKSVLKEGDWAVLDDSDYPLVLTGTRLGRIVSIKARTDAPQWAEIRLEPMRNLLELKEVMVVIKTINDK